MACISSVYAAVISIEEITMAIVMIALRLTGCVTVSHHTAAMSSVISIVTVASSMRWITRSI